MDVSTFLSKNMKPISQTLDSNRLTKKFKLFENICLPSLIRQKVKKNVLVIIKITDNLPIIRKNKLRSLVSKYK